MNLGSKRIAIVTRRFWPICSSTELAACEVGSALDAAGHHVDVFTIRWEKSWPQFFKYQNLNVHRINRPVTGPWGGFRYVRNLNRALAEANPQAIIVFGLGDEAWAVAKTFAGSVPFSIRIDGMVLGGSQTRPNLSNRQLTAIDAAQRLIVDTSWTAERLALNPAVDTAKITIISDPIPIDRDRSQPRLSKPSARVAISDAHPVLMIESDQPLVVTAAPMDDDLGMLDLVAAWPRVLRRFPRARLWIIGEGKNSRKVWDLIMDKHLVHSVIMPGSFDELDDVFTAADLYVHPLRSNQECSFLKLAMAKNLCPIVTQHPSTSKFVENRTNGIVVPPQDKKAISQAIIDSLADPTFRETLGQNAKKSLSPIGDSQLADQFLNPFLSILD